MKALLACLVAVSLFLVQIPVFAEYEKVQDPPNGRLPDGRAYRTDAQGNQLVDYIAELEQNIEGLTRQVHGLEEDLENKEKVISSLEKSGAKIEALQEKDLVKSAVTKTRDVAVAPSCPRCPEAREMVCPEFVPAKAVAVPEAHCPEVRCPELHCPQLNCPAVQCPAAAVQRCPPVNADCSVVSKKYSEDLEQTRMDLAIEKQDRSKEASSYATAKMGLLNQVAEKNTLLETLRVQLEARTARVLELERALSGKDEQISKAELKVASLSQSVEDLKTSSKEAEILAVKQFEAQREQNSEVKASLAMGRVPVAEYSNSSSAATQSRSASGSLTPAKSRAMDAIRGSLLGEMNSLRGLIESRDRSYTKYSKAAAKVQFRPSPAVSSKQRTPETLSQAIRNAESVSALMGFRQELAEIRGKIQQDVALISRMGRVN